MMHPKSDVSTVLKSCAIGHRWSARETAPSHRYVRCPVRAHHDYERRDGASCRYRVEKEIQADIVKLLKTVGAVVYKIGTTRKKCASISAPCRSLRFPTCCAVRQNTVV